MAFFWAIEDNTLDQAWVKTVSPFTNTQIPADVKEYTVHSDADTDAATLNTTWPGRFHVGTSPKPH